MTPILLDQSAALCDRLAATLEAIVISDRWVAHHRGCDRPSRWQQGLMQTAQACATGEPLTAQVWQPHFHRLGEPAAVLINALPYLWLKADAHSHHRATVEGWLTDLQLPPAEAKACKDLFLLLCGEMRHATPGRHRSPVAPAFNWRFSGEPEPELGQALALVAQSQGQMAVALKVAAQRGWGSATIALVGLLVGLTGGRASLGAKLRQRWLIDYSDPNAGTPDADPWHLLDAHHLEAIATELHHRWAGLGAYSTLPEPAFPLGIRV
ncbi:hypothetical protein [Nodosilinea sp. E11]|uniref:hypothetical protein n=1 Tax=Nodosilinea sp. E11 TaxID=3037479 RepID=UPI00293410AB|nr:hypothetical protein [Nodosilinea sp. E11]WOD38270.1 hypothetical protein RRF56_18835 [Nodosilinea sp. E11]